MSLICEIIYIQRYLKFILTIDIANRWEITGINWLMIAYLKIVSTANLTEFTARKP